MQGDHTHNVVPGTVHGMVSQVGSVHGDLHIHGVPKPAEPPVDLAVRIANLIADLEQRSNTLTAIAESLFESDPDRAEHVINQIPDRAKSEEARLGLAFELAQRDPERASRLIEPFLDETTVLDVELWLYAVIVLALARTAPGRAAHLVRRAEERPDCSPEGLAWLAAACHGDDPRACARLVDLAERAALRITDQDDRDRELRRVADHVAPVDLGRATEILQKISPATWASRYVWPGELKHAATVHREYALTLFDHSFRALRNRDAELDHKRVDLAISAASVDVYRAEAVAARIVNSHKRVKALLGMAQQISATDPGQTRQWLEDAKAVAIAHRAEGDPWSNKPLGEVATAAVELDPALGREIVQLIVGEIKDRPLAMELHSYAGCIADADPAQAEQIVERALKAAVRTRRTQHILLQIAGAFAEIDPARALRALDRAENSSGSKDDHDHLNTAEVLIKISNNLAVWDPADAKAVLNRAQRELRAVRAASYSLSEAWKSFTAVLVQLDPAVVERLAIQMPGRDDVLAAMALGVLTRPVTC